MLLPHILSANAGVSHKQTNMGKNVQKQFQNPLYHTWKCLFPSIFDHTEKRLLFIFMGKNSERQNKVINIGYQAGHSVLTPLTFLGFNREKKNRSACIKNRKVII